MPCAALRRRDGELGPLPHATARRVREGKNLKGRLLEILLTAGGKRVLGNALANTARAIEARTTAGDS